MMKSRRGMQFCCFGVPLINIGSYFIVIENALVGLGLILLAFVPPRIVATMDAIPAWSKVIMGCLGIAVLLWQILGFIAIGAEKTTLYRTYIRINFALTLATIAAAVAFIVASAVQHTQTVRSCVLNYGSVAIGGSAISVSSSTNEVEQISQDICNIFIWVQVGLMGLVTLLAGLTQLYMCFAQRAYGRQQREATRIKKTLSGATEEIPLASRQDGW